MFQKILIANRGEIACRVILTATKLGIETVAVYSTVDQHAPHVSLASEAVCIGDAPATDSYLNIAAIIEAATKTGADAIHPGYGFLSENPAFAQACIDANITFIGPPIDAMTIMGSKQRSKQVLEKTDVPLTPGYHGKAQSLDTLLTKAKAIGFPVLIKASSGGGGKGMRVVNKEADFKHALESAQREATASFGDATVLLEKNIINPQHIEIQVMADNHGNVVHVFERECSIQRRHQKIIEEAPATNLSATHRKKLAEAAVTVAKSVKYRGAGTVEFLVSGKQFYFIEMNTRLQVEHPVTEMTTTLDLVEWQIRIAANETLPCSQKDIQQQGAAIECRIYAEDPQSDFMPSIGKVEVVQTPSGEGIRLDNGINPSDDITPYYDPMIAKLITHGVDREQAIARMQYALSEYHIAGIKTNIPYLQALMSHEAFSKGPISTAFLSDHTIVLPEPDITRALLTVAAYEYTQKQPEHDLLKQDTFAWQMHLGPKPWDLELRHENDEHHVVLIPESAHTLTVNYNNNTYTLDLTSTEDGLRIDDGNCQWHAPMTRMGEAYIVFVEHAPVTLTPVVQQTDESAHAGKHPLNAPMTSTVVAILKQKGDTIKAGDHLMVLEAMKMEHTIRAPNDGTIVDIFYNIGAQVSEGEQLLELKGPA